MKDAVSGGSGSGSQWVGARSLPVHPFGMVSLRQHETRMVPGHVRVDMLVEMLLAPIYFFFDRFQPIQNPISAIQIKRGAGL